MDRKCLIVMANDHDVFYAELVAAECLCLFDAVGLETILDTFHRLCVVNCCKFHIFAFKIVICLMLLGGEVALPDWLLCHPSLDDVFCVQHLAHSLVAGSIYLTVTLAKEEHSIVLWLIDQQPSMEEINKIAEQTENKKLIIVKNKSDKADNNSYNLLNHPFVAISAKHGTGIEALEQAIYEAADIPTLADADFIVTNARHYDALVRAHQSILRVINGLQMQLSGDLLSEDLRQALDTLSEITGGQITPNEVLGNIFKNFCVGK